MLRILLLLGFVQGGYMMSCKDVRNVYRVSECCTNNDAAIRGLSQTSCPQTMTLVVSFTVTDPVRFENEIDGWIESTKKEPGALQYEWFIKNENGVPVSGTVIERYENSQAFVDHATAVQGLFNDVIDFEVQLFNGAKGFGYC